MRVALAKLAAVIAEVETRRSYCAAVPLRLSSPGALHESGTLFQADWARAPGADATIPQVISSAARHRVRAFMRASVPRGAMRTARHPRNPWTEMQRAERGGNPGLRPPRRTETKCSLGPGNRSRRNVRGGE